MLSVFRCPLSVAVNEGDSVPNKSETETENGQRKTDNGKRTTENGQRTTSLSPRCDTGYRNHMTTCAIPADTKLETPEGPLTVKTVGASPTSVMTRTDDGMVRFAMSSEVRKVAEAQPVLRVTLDNGRALRVGAAQILLTHELREVTAGDLHAGDALLNAFAFPVG